MAGMPYGRRAANLLSQCWPPLALSNAQVHSIWLRRIQADKVVHCAIRQLANQQQAFRKAAVFGNASNPEIRRADLYAEGLAELCRSKPTMRQVRPPDGAVPIPRGSPGGGALQMQSKGRCEGQGVVSRSRSALHPWCFGFCVWQVGDMIAAEWERDDPDDKLVTGLGQVCRCCILCA